MGPFPPGQCHRSSATCDGVFSRRGAGAPGRDPLRRVYFNTLSAFTATLPPVFSRFFSRLGGSPGAGVRRAAFTTRPRDPQRETRHERTQAPCSTALGTCLPACCLHRWGGGGNGEPPPSSLSSPGDQRAVAATVDGRAARGLPVVGRLLTRRALDGVVVDERTPTHHEGLLLPMAGSLRRLHRGS